MRLIRFRLNVGHSAKRCPRWGLKLMTSLSLTKLIPFSVHSHISGISSLQLDQVDSILSSRSHVSGISLRFPSRHHSTQSLALPHWDGRWYWWTGFSYPYRRDEGCRVTHGKPCRSCNHLDPRQPYLTSPDLWKGTDQRQTFHSVLHALRERWVSFCIQWNTAWIWPFR